MATATTTASESAGGLYVMESVVRGHHVYKCVWTPRIGEQLQCKHEENNSNDVRAVAIAKDGIVVGHLPRELTHLTSGRRNTAAAQQLFHTRAMQLRMYGTARGYYDDVILPDTKFIAFLIFARLKKNSHSQLLDYRN